MPIKIGIISDSHCESARTRWAVAELQRLGATVFLHAGDVEDVSVIDCFKGLNANIVAGNCDRPVALEGHAKKLGIRFDRNFLRIMVDGRWILLNHGHDEQVMKRACTSQVDFVIHGHVHHPVDRMEGSTRVLCPGSVSVSRPKSLPLTVLLLTPSTGEAQWIEVPR
ncbi:MAG: YfcE family phosphodiesterase [Planctomycetota bacterium]|nr:YfcE family phosphodiesterase [Planctomycetota bacterium]